MDKEQNKTLPKHLLPVKEILEPIEFAEQQLKIFWLPDEVKVEKDIQDVLVNLTPAERHGVITTLKLFSLYETHAGSEYWSGRYRKIFNGPEFERMASVFAMFELAVHSPFYSKINDLLYLDKPEFYMSYLDNPVMKDRIDFIGECIDHPNDAVSCGVFSMVEGVILYSNFAYLKHFQNNGKNKLLTLIRGINFSLRDEHMHQQAGAWSFRYLTKDWDKQGQQWQEAKEQIVEAAKKMYEHEAEIIKMVFSEGKIEGITEHQMQEFVKSRINLCLKDLGIDGIFEVKYNPIATWFYKGIENFSFNDFFSGLGNQYHRNWDENGFVWNTKGQE